MKQECEKKKSRQGLEQEFTEEDIAFLRAIQDENLRKQIISILRESE